MMASATVLFSTVVSILSDFSQMQRRTVFKLQQTQQQTLHYKKTDWREGQNLRSLDSPALSFHPFLHPLSSFLHISIYWLSLSSEVVSRKQRQQQHRWDVFICACQTAVHGMWVWQLGHFQTNRGYSARLVLKKTRVCAWEGEMITSCTQNMPSCFFLMHAFNKHTLSHYVIHFPMLGLKPSLSFVSV